VRHAAAELCLLVSQGAHDRIRQALHSAADNCTLARFPKAVESSGWRKMERGRHDRIGQARRRRLSVSRSPKAIGGNERGGIAAIAGPVCLG
jgi:hypothetical protein